MVEHTYFFYFSFLFFENDFPNIAKYFFGILHCFFIFLSRPRPRYIVGGSVKLIYLTSIRAQMPNSWKNIPREKRQKWNNSPVSNSIWKVRNMCAQSWILKQQGKNHGLLFLHMWMTNRFFDQWILCSQSTLTLPIEELTIPELSYQLFFIIFMWRT